MAAPRQTAAGTTTTSIRVLPGDVVEDERRDAGVRVLEGAPHALAHRQQRRRGRTAGWVLVVRVVVSLLSLGRLSHPEYTHKLQLQGPLYRPPCKLFTYLLYLL